MRRLVGLLTTFDWITPSWALAQDIWNDPNPFTLFLRWKFADIPIDYGDSLDSGWNAADIQNLLNRAGVKHWGWHYHLGSDRYWFTVPKDQREWTLNVLESNGVAINERYYPL